MEIDLFCGSSNHIRNESFVDRNDYSGSKVRFVRCAFSRLGLKLFDFAIGTAGLASGTDSVHAGARLTPKTNGSGNHAVPEWMPGNCDMKAKHAGFASKERVGVDQVRDFIVHEGIGVRVRMDAFHATSTPSFSNPSTALDSSSYGIISSAFGNRLIQLTAEFHL